MNAPLNINALAGFVSVLAAALLFAAICVVIVGGGLLLALLGVPPRLLAPSDNIDVIGLVLLILFPVLALAPLVEWWFKLWYGVDARLMAIFFKRNAGGIDDSEGKQ